MKSLHELIVELESWLSHLRHHAVSQAPVSSPAPQSPAPQVAAPAAPEAPKPETGSDNWLTRDIASQANPAAQASGPAAPAVDTSGATLDFNVVGNGVPINLDGQKTIVNCPASVTVQVLQASGQSGAHNTYTATVNGVASFCPNVQALLSVPAQGPTVTVSVDSPGLQMEIRG